ncbi:MAG TPA: CPBP family intramembrane glutamic endopeptidase [Kofleriaceae bacterium]
MADERTELGTTELARSAGVASVLALAFAALLAALAVWVPASEAQRRAADPLVQLLDGRGGPWLIVAATVVVAIAWKRYGSVRRSDVGWALVGVAAAMVFAFAIRAIVGNRLPAFIPSEESARPGITLGLAAGLVEEVVFRLALLPCILLVAARSIDRRMAAGLAVLVTAALFSLSHELGPGGGVFDPRFMLTRFAIPGLAMSIVALRVNLTFVVFAHCTAHLLIPSLFPG